MATIIDSMIGRGLPLGMVELNAYAEQFIIPSIFNKELQIQPIMADVIAEKRISLVTNYISIACAYIANSLFLDSFLTFSAEYLTEDTSDTNYSTYISSGCYTITLVPLTYLLISNFLVNLNNNIIIRNNSIVTNSIFIEDIIRARTIEILYNLESIYFLSPEILRAIAPIYIGLSEFIADFWRTKNGNIAIAFQAELDYTDETGTIKIPYLEYL